MAKSLHSDALDVRQRTWPETENHTRFVSVRFNEPGWTVFALWDLRWCSLPKFSIALIAVGIMGPKRKYKAVSFVTSSNASTTIVVVCR